MSSHFNQSSDVSIGNFYSDNAKDYEKIYDDYLSKSQPIIAAVCDEVSSSNSHRICIIDLGCGTGLQLAATHKLLIEKGFKSQNILALGLDITESMIQEATTNHSDLEFSIGDLLDGEVVSGVVNRITEFCPDFVVVIMLGNTIGNISPQCYDSLSQRFRELTAMVERSVGFVEFRDGDLLSREKPTFELRCNKQFKNEHILSFYVMEHLESNYPTQIYVFKLFALDGQRKFSVKRDYTESGFYVRPETFAKALNLYGNVVPMSDLKSGLDYGLVWKIEPRK